jgi:hypothetical protein
MSSFDTKLKNYLTLYKIPIGPNQLDPTVFYFSETGDQPKLLPIVQSQIARDVETLASGQPQRILHYYLIGPALKPGSKNRTGELKVIIVLNKNLMDVDIDGLAAEQLLKLAKNLSGKLASGTTRPINYTISIRNIELDKYNGVYDLSKNDWVKTPNGLTK